MEGRGVLAKPGSDDSALTVWTSSQMTNEVFTAIVDMLLDRGPDYAASINKWGEPPNHMGSAAVCAGSRLSLYSRRFSGRDGVHHWSFSVFLANFDVNAWHTYVIRWLPGRTEWWIDGVQVGSTDKAQPDAPTPVRLNFWAPASSWTDAYSSSLAPARKASGNKRYYYDVDWVEVRQLP